MWVGPGRSWGSPGYRPGTGGRTPCGGTGRSWWWGFWGAFASGGSPGDRCLRVWIPFSWGKFLSFLFFCLASGSGVVADPGAVAVAVAVAWGPEAGTAAVVGPGTVSVSEATDGAVDDGLFFCWYFEIHSPFPLFSALSV